MHMAVNSVPPPSPGRPPLGRPPPASSASRGLAVLDFAAPGPRLFAAAFDQLLEPLQVPAHLRPHNPKQIAGNTLEARFALDVHLDVDPCLRVTDRLEGNRAIVLDLAFDRPPGDPLVWALLGDLGRPLTRLTANFGDPPDMAVIELLHGLDPVHELRKLLELRPLVVGLLHRNLDLDRIINLRH